MRRRIFGLGLSGLGLVSIAATAVGQVPYRVADLASGSEVRSPFRHLGAAAEGRALFWAEDGLYGLEPWITDGTAAGTRPFTEVCPGLCRDAGPFEPEHRTVFDGDRAYFVAADGVHGLELWRADGTETGTRLVADLCPGSCSSEISQLALVDGRLFFRADAGGTGAEPWTSDGTAAGTRPLGDLRPGPFGSFPSSFLPLGDGVAFQAFDDDHGTEWWASDGTAEGTRRLTDLCPGECSAATASPIAAGGAILFSTSAPGTAEILYRLDPDGTVQPLAVLCTEDCDSFIPFLYPAGDRFFLAKSGRLWSTDGTAAGTGQILDLPAGVRRIDAVVEIGGGVRLLVTESASLRSALWRLEDGALAGPLLELPGSLYLAARDDDAVAVNVDGERLGLWRSDGTAAGTVLIDELPTPVGFNQAWRPVTVADGRVLIAARTGEDFRFELWATDGRVGAAERLVGAAAVAESSDPAELTALGTRVLFRATTGEAGTYRRDLWASAGTAAGTELLAAGVDPEGLVAVRIGKRERVFFTAFDEVFDVEPWLSDGTAAGTAPLADVAPGADRSWAREPVGFRGSLVFLADRGNGQKIWRSDGTEAGTELLVDVEPDWRNEHTGCPVCSPPSGPGPIFPRELRVLDAAAGSRLVFVARQDESGAELWASDGTAAGTELVADLRPGEEGSEPEDLLVVPSAHGDRLFFTADPGDGRALWAWHGPGSEPVWLRAVDAPRAAVASEGLYVWLEQRDDGAFLATSDGTVAGTAVVAELAPGAVPGDELVALSDRVYFVVADEAGAELWSSDLTAAGSDRIVDLWPGVRGSYPETLRVLGAHLYFSADDGVSGRELWRLDPSAREPLQRLGDVAPGVLPSSPRELALAGARVFWSADDGVSGREPWAAAAFVLRFLDAASREAPLPEPRE